MKTSWRLLPCRVLRAAENMAVDEAVFRLNRREALPPTLRFFGWQPPAVSLGYFQKTSREIDVETCRREGIDIVRRPTGGKAVLHEHELTYSLVAAMEHPLFTGDILETYRIISACIVEALERLGLTPEMVSEGRSAAGTPLEAYCFAAPSKYELLVGGRKICGSAQVRAGGAFLQHGSLLIDIDPARAAAVMRVPAAGISGSTTTLREQLGQGHRGRRTRPGPPGGLRGHARHHPGRGGPDGCGRGLERTAAGREVRFGPVESGGEKPSRRGRGAVMMPEIVI